MSTVTESKLYACKNPNCSCYSSASSYCTRCTDLYISSVYKNVPVPKDKTLDGGSATSAESEEDMSKKYPKYHKDVSHLKTIDVYGVHQIFNIEDPSGAIQHASKKLLLSGVRTGGKSKFKDIQEARDTLNRWLEINKPTE